MDQITCGPTMICEGEFSVKVTTLLALYAATNAKRVAIGVTNVTLTDVPGHVSRRPGSRDAELQSELIHGIYLRG